MTLQPISALPTWLHMLAQVYSPQSATLVGAGNGTGPLVQWLLSWASTTGQSALALTLLEPHAPSMAQLAKRMAGIEQNAHWQLLNDMLVPEGDHTYHLYNHESENGMLPPHALHPQWPGLQLLSEQRASGVTLDSLLPTNWMLVDCLPAAHLLHGHPLPACAQVVLARVVLADTAPAGSSLDCVQKLLSPSGFKNVAVFAERNNAIGKALYVRDPQSLHARIDQLAKYLQDETIAKQQAEQHRDELSQAKAQLLNRLAEETQSKKNEAHARAVEKNDKDKALAHVQQLAHENAQAKKHCDELAKAKEVEMAAKLSATNANSILQSQLDQLTQSLENQIKAHEIDVKEALEKSLIVTRAEKMACSKEKFELNVAKEKAEKLAIERQSKIKLLEQQLKNFKANVKVGEDRYRSLEAELLKAEAQIELIKAFVLQGSAK